jgi:two-component system, NarL family, response regulator DesR
MSLATPRPPAVDVRSTRLSRRAIDAGTAGFVVKDTPATELADAVRRVHSGLRVVDPDPATESFDRGTQPAQARDRGWL